MGNVLDPKRLLAFVAAMQSFNCVFCINAKLLSNQRCLLRETLVHVEHENGVYYFPLVVKLHRCGGSCRNVPPIERKCVASTSEQVPVLVRNLDDLSRTKTIYMLNETSCNCPCATDASECNPKRQAFDKRSCRCVCKKNFADYWWACRPPWHWDAPSCSCRCRLRCNHLQILDKTSCRCKCKASLYEDCRALNKYVNPRSCRCASLSDIQKSSGRQACEGFSTKWLVIVVSMGFIMFLILAFDCILYGKKTGLSYKLLSCCRKKEPRAPDDKNGRLMLQERR